MNIKKLFDKPKIIGIVADVDEGKSNLIYYLMSELSKTSAFSLYTYGLRKRIPNSQVINSVNEMEQIRNSILVIDEFFTLFDLNNRKIKNQIENTLRLIFHNNNILILAGVGENFKKFISSKLSVIFYKKVTFDDLINGSGVKKTILNYKGKESGTTLLNLSKGEAIVFSGLHFELIDVPYMKEYDSKLGNEDIIKNIVQKKSVPKCAKKLKK